MNRDYVQEAKAREEERDAKEARMIERVIKGAKYAGGIFLLFLIYGTFIDPYVNVWSQRQRGKAELAHAEYSRQIATCEALAKKESAKALAEAEVIRAEGVSKANRIIGDSLKGNESYLRYLWIDNMSSSQDKTIVYIPTEASLPVLEAQRLK